MNLQDKVVSVTGGTKGIGAQTAFALAKRGAHIVINGHHEDADANDTRAVSLHWIGNQAALQLKARKSLDNNATIYGTFE